MDIDQGQSDPRLACFPAFSIFTLTSPFHSDLAECEKKIIRQKTAGAIVNTDFRNAIFFIFGSVLKIGR
jgi:hypothetical protein